MSVILQLQLSYICGTKITIYKPSQPFLLQVAGLGPGLKFAAASLRDTGAERCFYRWLLRPGCPRGCWRCTVYGNGEGCFQKSVAFVHMASFGLTASADNEQLKMRGVHTLSAKGAIFERAGLCEGH